MTGFWVCWLWIPLLAGGVLAQGSGVGDGGSGWQYGGDLQGAARLEIGFGSRDGRRLEIGGGLREQRGGDLAREDGSVRQRVGFVGSRATEAFDAGYYHLRLDIDVAAPGVVGATTIEGTVVSGTLDSLALDFSTNMVVDSVWSDGAAVRFRHEADVLTLALGTSRVAGERIKADVYYHGLPAKQEFDTFEFGTLSNGDPFVWSLSEPYGARQWWPSKDHPSDKADSVRVTVTVPEPMRVGSNGLLLSEVDHGDGRTTFDWFSGYPISTYLVSVTGGVYDVYEQTYRRPDSLADHLGHLNLPVLHYAFAGSNVYDSSSPLGGWKHVIDILPLQEYWFGAYPFSAEKYGHAQFTRGGGMEHQTMSSMGGAGVGLIAHELAHQWFGDAVTMETWPHLWLNEGFATYAELLTWNAREHLSPGTYATIFDLYYGRALRANGTLVLQDTTSVDDMFSHPRVYAKGGMVLHMLRGIVGDEVFRDILRTYASLDSLQYRTASTEDFEAIAEKVSGQNLDAFFRQWVTEGTGYPVYDVRWSAVEDADGYDVFVDASQTQGEPLSNVSTFVMPVIIEVHTAGGTQRFVVQNEQRAQSFTLHVPARPTAVEFDPDRLILREVGVNTGIERPEVTDEFDVYPNPAQEVLHIRARRDARAELFDLAGRQVIIADLDAVSETDIDIGGLAPGFYFLRVSTPEGASVRPIVVLP